MLAALLWAIEATLRLGFFELLLDGAGRPPRGERRWLTKLFIWDLGHIAISEHGNPLIKSGYGTSGGCGGASCPQIGGNGTSADGM